MKLRCYAMAVTGCLAFIMTVIGLTDWTMLDFRDVMSIAVVICGAAVFAVYALTEPRIRVPKTEPRFFKLDPHEYEKETEVPDENPYR